MVRLNPSVLLLLPTAEAAAVPQGRPLGNSTVPTWRGNFTVPWEGPAPPTVIVAAAAPSPPLALPQRATAEDLRWQPALDFDTDGCYNVPAIGADGRVAEGLPHEWVGLATDCRDEADLDNNNVYARQRCNGGWCVHLYGYYFEKDVGVPYFFGTGHRHDWEHVAVWVSAASGRPEYVAASQHGDYEVRPAADVRWDGDHPKMVYHKDGLGTHAFRFANEADDRIENHKGIWFRGDLVSYNGFPSTELRDKLFAHDFGAATIDFKDSTFPGAIAKAMPPGITFDVYLDEGSPGTP
ncbi:hypothetical protein VTH06DRAFT_5818 [Thermothelomyces fergusii]